MKIHYDWLLNICGATIRVALEDFKAVHDRVEDLEEEFDNLKIKKNMKRRKMTNIESYRFSKIQEMLREYQTAKRFLFSDRLDLFCEGTGANLSPDFIRSIANNGKTMEKCFDQFNKKYLRADCPQQDFAEA